MKQQIASNELSTLAYNKVKNMIISKQLVPGEKIVQDKLAEQLGISRTPLKAALKMLEAENLMESIPRRGMIVKEFDDTEVLEIYDCRMALEGTAVRLFTETATQKQMDYISTIFAPFKDGNINVDEYQKADSLFHNYMIQNCGNSRLNKLFQQGNLLVCIDLIGLVRPPEETLKEHAAIIKAIKDRDAGRAEELAKKHLFKSKTLIQSKLEKE